MTEAELQAAGLELAKVGLKAVLAGELPKYSTNVVRLCDADTILEGLGAERLEFQETNGWQADFWVDYEYQDKLFTLSGSAWYGGCELYLKD